MDYSNDFVVLRGFIMNKSKSKKYVVPNDYDKFSVASSTECTGLITVPPETEDELENYGDIMDFGPICTENNDNKSAVQNSTEHQKQQ